MLNGDTSNSSNLNNINNAIATAQDRADDNKILTQALTSSQIQIRTGVYNYDSSAQQFSASFPSSPGSNAWSVMEVTISGKSPTYFGRVFNINSFAVKTQAVAAHRPRDVALILDFSGSMKFGTESAFTRAAAVPFAAA